VGTLRVRINGAQWAGTWKLPKMNNSHKYMALSVSKTREKIQFSKKKINSNGKRQEKW